MPQRFDKASDFDEARHSWFMQNPEVFGEHFSQTPPRQWSFHDGAKAVGEIFKIVDDLVRHGGKAVAAYRWYQRRKAARALDALRFEAGGIIDILRKIEDGKSTKEDLEELKDRLQVTEVDVDSGIKQLIKLKYLLREQISMEAAIRLEQIIDGVPDEKGKRAIRGGLRDLCRLDSYRDARRNAKHLIGSIEALNRRIIALHEVILRDKPKLSVQRSKAKPPTKKRKIKSSA
jgi:hypothetical protein